MLRANDAVVLKMRFAKEWLKGTPIGQVYLYLTTLDLAFRGVDLPNKRTIVRCSNEPPLANVVNSNEPMSSCDTVQSTVAIAFVFLPVTTQRSIDLTARLVNHALRTSFSSQG